MSTTNKARAVIVASIGGGLEMYDFSIYIFFAPIVAQLFFPQNNSLIAILNTFAVFALGYFARPIGAVLFGHFGDKFGRKSGLLVTIMLMALATGLIGLLPTYQSIGLAAPICLVLLRLVQGIAMGGDLPGAVTFVSEYATAKQRGFLCSLVFCGINLGLLLASGAGALLAYALTHEQLLHWGWRIAFILGTLVGIIGYYLRIQLADTPSFQALQQSHGIVKLPVIELFRRDFKKILHGVGVYWLFGTVIAQLFLYMPTYLHEVIHMDLTIALIINSLNILIFSLLIPIFGTLSDRYGRKEIIISMALGFILFSYPLYFLLNSAELMIRIIGLLGFAILTAGVTAVTPCLLTEIFATRVRYSGVAVTYNIGQAIFAGLAPIIATFLIHALNNIYAPSYNLILAACVTLFAAIKLKDCRKIELNNI